MTDFDFTPVTVSRDPRSPTGLGVTSGNDAKLRVTFHKKLVIDQAATVAEGRTIHKHADYCRIQIPGDKHNIVDEEVTEESGHKRRFPHHWAAYQAGLKEEDVGTPLVQLAGIDEPLAADLKALGILTIEHLAGVSDSNIHKLGAGGRALVERAKAFLEQAAGGAPIVRLTADNERLQGQIDALQQQLNELAAAKAAPGGERPSQRSK